MFLLGFPVCRLANRAVILHLCCYRDAGMLPLNAISDGFPRARVFNYVFQVTLSQTFPKLNFW